MIPKIIHYCWFGGNPKTKKMEQCIESWRKFCPDFQIIEWNEENFIIEEQCQFVREAYRLKKYAFVSDVARLKVVYENGGVYLDTDVELIKPIDTLLTCPCFLGWQDNNFVANGLGFGAEKGNPVVKENLQAYSNIPFVNKDGSLNMKACPIYTTEVLLRHGLKMDNRNIQTLDEAVVYPVEYFNPLDDATNRLAVTNQTFSIHWYAKTWVSKRNKVRNRITRIFHRWFGVDCFEPIKRFARLFHKQGL